MALTIGEGGSISASVSAADDAPMRVTFGKPLKPEIQLNSDDLNWGHSKRNAAAGVSVLSLIPVVSLIFNKLKAMRRAHMEKKEKEKRVKRGMAKKIKRLQAELELASGIVLKVDDQRNEIELMQQEVRERKEYAAKLEEQLRSDVVQQEILRADLEDSVIEAVEEMKKANEEKLEVCFRMPSCVVLGLHRRFIRFTSFGATCVAFRPMLWTALFIKQHEKGVGVVKPSALPVATVH